MIGSFLKKSGHPGQKFFLLTDRNTHEHCLPLLAGSLPVFESEFILEPGEASKSLEEAEKLWQWLLEHEAHRDDLLINLGGGVVSDLGGFAASAYKRGMVYINIPTTLIGQADAAVGGKTGVNLGGGKNQLGSFHHPVAVFIDPKFLETLPEDQMLSGYAELLKCAFLAGDRHWEKVIKARWEKETDLTGLMRTALEVKISYVKKDLTDQGIRKALNFGHTLGHAFESLTMSKYPPGLLHGEAVALGMIGEAFLSWRVTGLCWSKMTEFTGYLRNNFSRPPFTIEDSEEIIRLMMMDKKNSGGAIRFSLLKDSGDPAWDVECEQQFILKAIEFVVKEK
jgi:3-dehydroquinate synthase